MDSGAVKSVGLATVLVIINVLLIAAFSITPLQAVNSVVFQYPILGVLVYGALLTGGLYLARSGIASGNAGVATGGVALIQLAYGTLGAGIIGLFAASTKLVAILITGVVATGIAVLSGIIVYGTGHDFSDWGSYANYLFLGVLGSALVATFIPVLGIVSFFLALAGFITYLIHQVYVTKTRPGQHYMNAVGLYTAYMGVFVEILKLVARMLVEE